jgi:inner membrane protein
MNINLSGSEGLLFTPLGRSTSVFLQSEWESPSFTGSFLPVNRNIDEPGFTASWEVTHLNRNFPQNWAGNAFHPQESAFGLDLFQPVDHYQKAWRSSRYGMLFIALTFFVLIFIEITRKKAIHIFHYFLVALGLVLFFSLLNSLSEHIGFNLAYVISSASTILLISIFTGTLFREKKIALIIFCMLAVLYTFIYVLLTLENSAYLIGNIGLFVLLAIIMIFSVRLEFFKSKKLSVEDD